MTTGEKWFLNLYKSGTVSFEASKKILNFTVISILVNFISFFFHHLLISQFIYTFFDLFCQVFIRLRILYVLPLFRSIRLRSSSPFYISLFVWRFFRFGNVWSATSFKLPTFQRTYWYYYHFGSHVVCHSRSWKIFSAYSL